MNLFRQMKSKKVAFPEQLVSPRRKVFSGFSLVAGASVIVLTITFLNNSLIALGPHYSSIVTWPFIISPHVVPSSSPANAIGDLLDSGGEKKHGQNVSDIVKEGDSLIPNRDGVASEKLPSVGDVHGEVENGSFDVEEAMVQIQNQTHDPVIAKNGNFSISKGQGIDLEKRNGSVSGEDGRVIGKTGDVSQDRENVNAKEPSEEKNIGCDGNKKFIVNYTDGKAMVSENNNLANDSCSGKNIRSADEEKRDSEINHIGNSSEENKSDPQLKKMPNPLVGCDFFNGRWVKDYSKPYYPGSSCPFVDPGFDCHRFGRPDEEYLKWKWQPYGCDIPSLNATGFLERLRGKRLVFVGDSLNRNMWESLVCILRHSIRDKERVYEVSGRREFKRKGFYAFRFEDYNCTVESAVAPFLVRGLSFNHSFGSYESIRLDLMDERAPKFQDADILIFNTGAWWTDFKTAKGVNYYREGNYVYPKLEALDAYKKGIRTWAKWVDQNIDGRRTQVFFKGLSHEHYRGGRWNSGGQCHKEVEPIFNERYLQKYPRKMRILEGVLHKMKTPVIYLNLSRMTDFRKDGHPSIYRMEYKSDKERIAAEKLQDCNHWCLPGVPDNWNELLYASLLKEGRGSWTS